MKAIFPCTGSIILNKQDIEPLNSYYKTELLRSNMYNYYKNSTEILQVGNFTYIPSKVDFVLDENDLLQLNTLKRIFGLEVSNSNAQSMQNSQNDLIDDGDILSNPFFTTLKPLN